MQSEKANTKISKSKNRLRRSTESLPDKVMLVTDRQEFATHDSQIPTRDDSTEQRLQLFADRRRQRQGFRVCR